MTMPETTESASAMRSGVMCDLLVNAKSELHCARLLLDSVWGALSVVWTGFAALGSRKGAES